MKRLPPARNTDIVVHAVDDEVLVYDLITHKAYALNETSAAVYKACDGKTRFDDLTHKSGFSEEIIYLTLDELQRLKLVEKTAEYNSPFAGMSRREAIRKVGAASMIALPIISSLVAPTAGNAQSGSTAACTTPISQGQGTCPAGERCVTGTCSPCIASGQALPGGCTPTTVARCCNLGCNIPSGLCF